MNDRRLTCRPRETSSDLQTAPGQVRAIPDDLLRQASRRLEFLALLGAMLWVLAPVGAHLAQRMMRPGDPAWLRFSVNDGLATLGLALSLLVYAYLRRADRRPAAVMNLALFYMVATAFVLGPLTHSGTVTSQARGIAPMITWIPAVILMTAALVPAPPRRMLVAGLVAASMDPIGMVIARGLGRYHFDSTAGAFLMHYPNYLLLGVAVAISGVMTRLGQQVGREREMGSYQLGALLGRGGMGEVYRATHRMLARPAAIKLIRPEVLAMAGDQTAHLAIARFRREADAAAKLRSPHTVVIYDFGVTDDQTLYLVMELLEGMDLETLVRDYGPVPARRVVHLLRQACESLDEAHAAGMIHRDVKPANLHVGPVGLHHDFVKVLDFGLVKTAAQRPSEDSIASAAGLTPGTPAYMAPEMAGDAPVDGRADLYALGCVAYFLLTGQRVFDATTQVQMILKHVQETPLPPSRRGAPDVLPELDRVVLDCLAKQPEARPASAAELDRRLSALPLAPWSEDEARQWWAAHLARPQ